ncbi:MAG: TMEM198/TM7SF3 family protein [Blautia glucerasea]|nr:TMEM198/TM7SF3 family protein [Blautia glucerasea]MDY3086061.1 DUF4203 domain-containing protein [Blautia sp.]
MNVEILNKLGEMMDNILGIQVLSGIMIIVFGIVFVFGLTNCILGYRLLRFWMMIFGFCIGAGIGFFLVYRIDTEEKAYYMAAMLGIGVVMAVLAFMIYRAGIFILGAGLGLFLSIYLIHPTSSFSFFLCILIGVGIGVLALRYDREVIIVGTSFLGGVTAGLSLAKLLAMDQIPYGILFGAAFAILGMLIQFAINKPRAAKAPRREEQLDRRSSEERIKKKEVLEDEADQEELEEKILEEELLDEDDFEDYFTGKLDLTKDERVSGSKKTDGAKAQDIHSQMWEQKKQQSQRRTRKRKIDITD